MAWFCGGKLRHNVRRFKKLRFAIYEVNLKRLLCAVKPALLSLRAPFDRYLHKARHHNTTKFFY
jgi:hypothetical protein